MLTTIDLTRYFVQGTSYRRVIRAVEGVSLHIPRGEVFGLAGESGCGKSTFARLLLRLIEPTRGSVTLDGTDITVLGPRGLRDIRTRMQLIPQDPENAFNPRYTITESITEPFRIHGIKDSKVLAEERDVLLDRVGLPRHLAMRYPFELSGGQLQRAVIARALACKPVFLVADEPTSTLDPSTQAKLVHLLLRIVREEDLTLLFVSHDIRVLARICDRIGVMHAGAMVEIAPAADILQRPCHPVTASLTERGDLAAHTCQEPVAQARQPCHPLLSCTPLADFSHDPLPLLHEKRGNCHATEYDEE